MTARTGSGHMRSSFALALALVLTGCLGAQPEATADWFEPTRAAAAIGEPIVQTHDHTIAADHVASRGLRLVTWEPLIPDELGDEGFAGLRIVDDIAYLATDGAHAGFLMIDVSDPTSPRLLSQYKTPGGASQEAVPTSDGDYVFLNLQRVPAATAVAADPTRGDGAGIQIIDVRDKSAPKFESFFPVEVQGTHVMFYYEQNGTPYLVFNGQPTRQGLPTGDVYTPPPGNVVRIAEFVATPTGMHTLQIVGEFRLPESLTARVEQGCFPHDQWVEEHPLTGRLVLYVAYWDCGAVTVDITDPRLPVLLDVESELAPSTRNRIHYFRPDPTLRPAPFADVDTRVVAYSGPEIDLSPGEPGYLRTYDVTDPTAIEQIGSWRLPGEVENDKPYLFTPHNFDFHGDLLALAHYHAGIWVLNISDPEQPRHVAFYQPHGDEFEPFSGDVWRKTPNFPEAYFPNVYEAKWHTTATNDTYLLVSERGSGLYVLELDGSWSREGPSN